MLQGRSALRTAGGRTNRAYLLPPLRRRAEGAGCWRRRARPAGRQLPAVAPPWPGAQGLGAARHRPRAPARDGSSAPDPGAAARGCRRVENREVGWAARSLPPRSIPRARAGAATEGCCLCSSSGDAGAVEPASESGKSRARGRVLKTAKPLLHAADVRAQPPPLLPRLLPKPRPPPSPAAAPPALRDLESWLIVVERLGGRQARQGLGARVAPGCLQEEVPRRALPCAPGGGGRCREGRGRGNEPPGRTGRGGRQARCCSRGRRPPGLPNRNALSPAAPRVHAGGHTLTRAHTGRSVACLPPCGS